MRRFAFIIALLGMFTLVLLLQLPPVSVARQTDLDNLVINQRVEISGDVESTRYIYGETQLLAVNGMDVLYEGNEKLKGKNVLIIGRIEEYKGKKQIIADELFLS